VTGYGPERRDLGRRLAAARKAAGYTQQQLAVAAGYSRSTVSNAEIGHPDVAQVFWARCDQVLKSDGAYALAFDQVRTAERRQATGLSVAVPDAPPAGAFGRPQPPVFCGGMAEALAGYRDLGWPAADGDDGAELVTGDVLDALELPRAAGMLAASLWLYSQGHADDARRLPALPHPARSMAVITAGDRCFFLAAAGCSPWTGRTPVADPAGGRSGDDAAGPVIRWHAGGGRVPAPPSRLPGGDGAAWAHLPSRPVLLASPAPLLGLLTTAAASAGPGPAGLTLPGGIRLVPAAGR
jgi:DNA-binding XRE family transcriptional regulator